MQSGPSEPYLPVHLYDVYIMFQPNWIVSPRSMYVSVVGSLLMIFSIFTKPSNHLLLTKSHPSFEVQQTSFHIDIPFLILPTKCDIYLP